MAIAYQSIQTTAPTDTSGTSLVITKPTSLAAGDLMVAIISVFGSSPTVSTPTGWALTGEANNVNNGIYVFMKIANSSDAAASNFTFAGSWAVSAGGSIMRFTGAEPSTPSDQINIGTLSGTAYSGTGITPIRESTYMVIATNYNDGSSGRTTSGYAIGTDNPSWTEVADSTTSTKGFAIAYGSRPQTTATGTDSATLSGTASAGGYIAIFDILPARTVYATVLTLASTEGTAVYQRRMIQTVLTLASHIGTPVWSEVAKKWSNLAKSASSWINIQKN